MDAGVGRYQCTMNFPVRAGPADVDSGGQGGETQAAGSGETVSQRGASGYGVDGEGDWGREGVVEGASADCDEIGGRTCDVGERCIFFGNEHKGHFHCLSVGGACHCGFLGVSNGIVPVMDIISICMLRSLPFQGRWFS